MAKAAVNYFFPDMRERLHEEELMDMPDCDEKKLLRTVAQFKLLNHLFSRSKYLLKKHIIADMLKEPAREYRFIDLGAGGCDLAIWLCRLCRKLALKCRITCLDYDSRIVPYAIEQTRDYPEIEVLQESAFELDRLGPFDYTFSNHFLHHFKEEELIQLLPTLAQSTERVLLLNDLARSNGAYLGYTLFTGLFVHRSFAHYDGRLSIRRGFTQGELENLLDRCDLKHKLRVGKVSPARLYLHS